MVSRVLREYQCVPPGTVISFLRKLAFPGESRNESDP
jgi:hypothetical protein